MKKICDVVSYNKCKLYDFSDVINKFEEFFDLNLEEIEELLNNSYIIEWSELYDKLIKNGVNIERSEQILLNYEFYKKTLFNLRMKGLELVDLIKYLNLLKVVDYKENYELKLDAVGIYHFSSILKGKDINRILVIMYHLLNQFNENLKKINSIDSYICSNNLINTYFNVNDEHIYPNRDLVVYDDENKYLLDKTSFIVSNSKIKSKVKVKIDN